LDYNFLGADSCCPLYLFCFFVTLSAVEGHFSRKKQKRMPLPSGLENKQTKI